MQQHRKLNAQTIFLIDGIGAFVSALMLGFVLPGFEVLFGMPQNALYVLSAIAFLFSIYSFTNAVVNLDKPAPRLRFIAVANLCYCLLTVALLIAFYQQLTVYDLLYFVGELLIILSLAYFELKTATVSRTKK